MKFYSLYLSSSSAIRLSTFCAGAGVALLALICAPLSAAADSMEDEEYHRDYIYGVPSQPTEAWVLSRGGRLYDNWFNTLGIDEPETTHPAWPASNKRTGSVTWRCKSCHGWDYRGRDGKYASGSYQTGIVGVMGAKGKSVDAIAAALRGGPHGFTKEMIPDEQLRFVAAFISRGLDDMNRHIDPSSGAVKGDPKIGAPIFQTTCASCHGFDGRSLNWGDDKEPGYVGTEANANPWEVLHKIRNAHPGVEMISFRAFDIKYSVHVLAYAKTLPEK